MLEYPTVLGRVLVILVLQHVVVEGEQVDRDGVFTRVVLLHARQEGLCEEESGDPEHGRGSIVKPTIHSQC